MRWGGGEEGAKTIRLGKYRAWSILLLNTIEREQMGQFSTLFPIGGIKGQGKVGVEWM